MSHKRSIKSQRRAKRRRQAAARQPAGVQPVEPDLMVSVDRALAAGHPVALLELVSSLVSVVDPRRRNPFDRDRSDSPLTYDTLLESFTDVATTQTSAVLAAIAAMTADDLQAARIRREVDARGLPLPAWLRRLSDVQPYRIVEMLHVLGDGDDVIIGARLPTGEELTVLVYIDHNVGTLVKDAFVLDQPIGVVIDTMRSKLVDPDTVFRDLDAADARARVTEAVERGAITFPPFESDTWPGCRPLVEWLVRALPPGGVGYLRPEWDDADRQALLDGFFASPFGGRLDDQDHRGLLDTIVWFGTDYGPGDPLRWSPVSVEILLTDWFPRKIVADAEYLSLAPDLVRAFIRYSHHQRGIRATHTTETVAAVDQYEPGYQIAIRTPRRQGPMALLEAVGLLDEEVDGGGIDDDLDSSWPETLLDALRRQVGGDSALRALGTRPLPDEDFDWSGIPEDVHDRVAEVLDLCDGCCEKLLDREHRTACRRLLSRAASGDPGIFRRRGAAKTAAGAICWIIGQANDAFGPWGGLQVQEMLAHLGVSGSVSQRADVLLRAAGIESRQFGAVQLGSPALLVSGRRARIITARDLNLAGLEQPGESGGLPPAD